MMSLFYFIQVFVDDSNSIALWIVSLISSSGFALAMDKVNTHRFGGTDSLNVYIFKRITLPTLF